METTHSGNMEIMGEDLFKEEKILLDLYFCKRIHDSNFLNMINRLKVYSETFTSNAVKKSNIISMKTF